MSSSKPIENEASSMAKVRDNHYIFSHFALRQLARKDLVKFFTIMPTEAAAEAILQLWCGVNRDCGNPDSADLEFSEIYWHPVAINEFPCVVVQMPEPRAASEAWFVAVLMMEDMHADDELSVEPRMRYITLEQSEPENTTSETTLCEWRDNRHFVHGDGPAPDLHSFVRYLEVFVEYTR
jgi:hypothetical protein